MAGLWYRAGTASVTNGSKKVTGFGSLWKTTTYKPDKGHTFWGPDGKAYEIDYVESDTVLYLVMVYAGVTAASQAYSIDITRTSTIPAFSRELSAQLAYAQAQYDSWQQVLTGSGMVTLTAPDGQQVQVPSLSAFQPTSASLKALQALTPVKDKIPVFNGPAGAELITLTAFMRALLDDADAAAALTTLGAYPAAGGGIAGDFWRSGAGTSRFGLVDNLGFAADGKSCLVLLAKKYVGTALSKTGFVGRIFFNRGNAGNYVQSDYVDLNVTVAYIQNVSRMLRRSGASVSDAKIVEVTHGGDVYLALYRPAASSCEVVVTGHAFDFSLPLLIADATAYSITDVVTTEEDYHRGNILGQVSQSGGYPTGAIIERGSNANGEYTKFADGTMECWYGAKFSFSNSAAYVNFTWTLPIAHISGALLALSGTQAFDNGSPGRKYNRGAPSGSYGSGPASAVNLRLWATGTDTFASGDITDSNIPMYAKGRWF